MKQKLNKHVQHIQGRHIPEQLSLQRKQQEFFSKKTKRKKLEDDSQSFQWNYSTIILFTIIAPYLIRSLVPGLINSMHPKRQQQPLLPKKQATIHDQPIIDITENMNCGPKKDGVSQGKICHFNNTRFFLKKLPTHHSWQENSATHNQPGLISYEKFNQNFGRNNLKIQTPNDQFFRENNGTHENFYSGHAEIDFKYMGENKSDLKNIPQKEAAKLMVASTFIQDLHQKNWGYNKDGIVLIDVDSANRLPNGFSDYLHAAAQGFSLINIPMSISHIKEMITIYKEMLKSPLPKFHQDFKLSSGLYKNLLYTYINVCRNTIQEIRESYVKSQFKDENVASGIISSYFTRQLEKVAEMSKASCNSWSCYI